MHRVRGRVSTLLRHVAGFQRGPWPVKALPLHVRTTSRAMCTRAGATASEAQDESSQLEIGGVAADIHTPRRRELVPFGYFQPGADLTQDVLSHVRWMMQKDGLKQDMFLVGPPGPDRRRLALLYCQLTGREVEIVSVSRDTTESDLKQRREIVNGSALFVDQVCGGCTWPHAVIVV